MKNAMRAVVDANIWIKALIVPGGPQAQLLDAFMAKQFELVCSRPMLAELRIVLARPEIACLTHMDARDMAETIAYFRSEAEMVEVVQGCDLCRDPDDNKVIATALSGNAHVIVSQDSDLCNEEMKGPLGRLGIHVVSAREFLELLREHG